MFKKLIITSVLFSCGLSNVLAGSFYAGPGLNYENLRSGSVRYQGIRPIIIGGYGDWLTEGFYLAGELFAGPKAININNEPKKGIGLKSKYSYGGSLIPGVYLDEELMAYARFGLVSTKLESPDTRKSGQVIGLGLQTKVINCWYFRGEYNYVKYSSLSGMGSLRSDEFNIAVIYQLNWE